MKPYKNHLLSFSIDRWAHLYSLQQAIVYSQQQTGRKLTITGLLHKQAFLQNKDTSISINFIQTDQAPTYPLTASGTHILGSMLLSNHSLSTNIKVERRIFEELNKNLLEYADIEGICIIVTLSVLSTSEFWQDNDSLEIIQLDYSMKGAP